MSAAFALAAAAAVLAAPSPEFARLPSHAATAGLVDVSRFDDRAMVHAVPPAACVSGDFVKRPQAGCLRRAEHAVLRR